MRRCRARSRGCYGGKILADYAKAQGWNVVTVLNNDIIGNSCSSDGLCDDTHVRVLSEGPRSQGQADLAGANRTASAARMTRRRATSRAFSTASPTGCNIGLDVRQIWRTDRFGRGGDHIPFLEAGYPAARISVAVENYNWQHQDLRTENGIKYGDTIDNMDFAYLAKVTKLNVAALAAIASAPPPPEPKVEGAVSTDTTVSLGAGHRARRATSSAGGAPTANQWQERAAGSAERKARQSGCPVDRQDASRQAELSQSCFHASASTIGCSACPR